MQTYSYYPTEPIFDRLIVLKTVRLEQRLTEETQNQCIGYTSSQLREAIAAKIAKEYNDLKVQGNFALECIIDQHYTQIVLPTVFVFVYNTDDLKKVETHSYCYVIPNLR